LFITLEGVEGCGKSTQAKALYKHMLGEGIPTVLCREPGGTALGEIIRRYLKTTGSGILPITELLLFSSARAQLLSEVIYPSLEKGVTVICDRYTDSTLAYQGYGRGFDLDSIKTVNRITTGGLFPDLVIFLDLPVEIGLARKGSLKADRFEREDITFHQRVRNGYLELAKAAQQRWLLVNAQLPKKQIERIIWKRISGLLNHETDD